MTNATKANIIAALNAALGLAVAFGLALSPEQIGSILTLANALGLLAVGLTYTQSPKRVSG